MIRNTMGHKIIEGIIPKNYAKLTKMLKDTKYFVNVSYIIKNNEEKYELGYCKVPVRNSF
jgi:hypothetical protein